MKVSYRKIKEFLSVALSADDAAVVLTATGLEIEGVETVDDVPGWIARARSGAYYRMPPAPKCR